MNDPSPHHARRRAFAVLAAMITGVVIAGHFPETGSAVWFGIACGCLAASIPARSVLKSSLLVIAMALIAGGWAQLRTSEHSPEQFNQAVGELDTSDQRVPVEVSGILLDPIRAQTSPASPGDPPTWSTTTISTRIRIDGAYISDMRGRGTWIHASGVARVVLPDGFGVRAVQTSRPTAGDRVEILGMYKPTGGARNIGDLDWGALSAQSGRVGTIVVTDATMIRRIEHDGMMNRVSGRAIAWRSVLLSRSMRAIGLDSGEKISRRAMLGALLLGQRDPAFGEVYESFQRVGVAHVLAISGFHLALVIVLGIFFIRVLGEHARAETTIMITILILGMLLVPMRPPIVRAGVIVCALLLSNRFGRRYDRLTVLLWVGAGLLIWRPLDAFSLGYQLSMGITGLLVILANNNTLAQTRDVSSVPRIADQRPRGLIAHWRACLADTVKVNFGCWVVAMPAIMYHAGIVSLLAPIVSVALIPMVMVLMVIGYMQIALGVVSPGFAEHTVVVVDWLAGFVGSFIGWIDSLPGSSLRVGSIGPVWTILATAGMVAIVTGRLKARSWKAAGVVGVLIAWMIVEPIIVRDRSLLRMDMLDVGDGSCVLIQSGGNGLLWDCGSLDRRVGKQTARAARQLGINQIKDAIVTHDNLDHFNGLIDLARPVGLQRVWITGRLIDEPSHAWRETQDTLRSMGIEIVELGKGTTFMLGENELVCLWPDPRLITGMSDNNASVVLRIDVPATDTPSGDEIDHRTVLLTGDIERGAMNEIMLANPGLRADIIELPHHGSAKPGAFEFVQSLNPLVVLQSTGSSRLNDPRWEEVRNGRAWYATADSGGIWVRIARDGSITYGWAKP